MTRKQILTFIAMSIGMGVITVDIGSINVALPAIEKDFRTTVDTVQWVVNGYALSFAVLMVTCGRFADTFGRRKLFFIGLIIFGLASLTGALAANATVLIGSRVIQGAGAAMLWPAILGIIYSSVSEEQKGFAVGLILGVAGIGNAAGPLIGGSLTEFASWRWVLMVNVFLCVTAGVLAYLEVEKQPVEGDKKNVDYLGIATITISLVSLMYAINQSTAWGWVSFRTILLIIVFAAVMFLFVRVERKNEEGLIPPDVMSNISFMLISTIMFTLIPALFAILLYVPLYFEMFLSYSPLQAGASLVPLLAVYAITAPVAGKIYNYLGARISISAGMLFTFIGTIGVLFFGFGYDYYGFLPGLVVMGLGLGLAVPTITTAGVGAVRESRASLASGIVFMFQLVGGSLGLAIVTTIFTDIAKHDLLTRIKEAGVSLSGSQQSDVVGFILGSVSRESLLSDLGSQKLEQLLAHIHHAFVSGIEKGLGSAALLIAVGVVLCFFALPGKEKPSGEAK